MVVVENKFYDAVQLMFIVESTVMLIADATYHSCYVVNLFILADLFFRF